jgi:hypothetical protein
VALNNSFTKFSILLETGQNKEGIGHVIDKHIPDRMGPDSEETAVFFANEMFNLFSDRAKTLLDPFDDENQRKSVLLLMFLKSCLHHQNIIPSCSISKEQRVFLYIELPVDIGIAYSIAKKRAESTRFVRVVFGPSPRGMTFYSAYPISEAKFLRP